MIAPSASLIWTTAAVGLPAALLAAWSPGQLPVALLALLLLAALAVLDASRTPGRLAGLRLEFAPLLDAPRSQEDPPLFRLVQGREGALRIALHNEGAVRGAVRVGLIFPLHLTSADPLKHVVLDPEDDALYFEWPCVAERRGAYEIEGIHVDQASPWGFWRMRTSHASSCQVRAYPDLRRERSHMAALFLNRGGVGAHVQRQVGKGREFEQLREYAAGDSFDDIHWKATARRAQPITKMYQLERTQEVYVLVDCSRLSGREARIRDPRLHTHLDAYVHAALALGLVAEHQGDRFGVVTFSDQPHDFVRARAGRRHYLACREALYGAAPRRVNPGFDELMTFLRLRLRRRALLVMLTSLDDPVISETLLDRVSLIQRRHLMLVNMITPPGVAPLFTGAPAEKTDEVYERLAGHLQYRGLRELQQALRRRGIRLSLLHEAGLTPDVVSQYMAVKKRQAL